MNKKPLPPRFLLCLTGLVITSIMGALDHYIVNPALPQIMGEFGALAQLSWIITAFMLAATVSMPLFGKFSDTHGRRRLFIIAVVIFLVGSALCGAAQSLMQLIAFRAVQGIGAGGIGVLGMTALGDLVSPRDRPRYQGLFTATYALSSIAGPVVGGAVTEWAGWRWVFYINLPVGLIALAIIVHAFPRHMAKRKSHRIDYKGVVLLLTGTLSFLLALSRIEANGTLSFSAAAMFGISAIGFLALYRTERRAAEPILAVHLLQSSTVLNTILSSAMLGLAYFGSAVYLPLFFQLVGGMSVAESGLMLMPHLVMSTLVSVVYGQVVSRTGRYKPPILAGMALVTAGLLGLAASIELRLGFPAWIVCLLCMGTGGGLCMPNLMVSLQNAIRVEDLGVGTSTLSFCNQLAAVAGVAISGLLLVTFVRQGAQRYVSAEMLGEMLSAGVQLLERMPPAQRDQVVQVYEGAFVAIFMISAVTAALAVLFAMRIPALELRHVQEGAEPA